MQKITQKQIVVNRLFECGYCDNYWAIDNRVSIRLGAIIHSLNKEGWDIKGGFSNPKQPKNYYYNLIKAPSQGQRKNVCCASLGIFGMHSLDCAVIQPKQEIKNQGMLL